PDPAALADLVVELPGAPAGVAEQDRVALGPAPAREPLEEGARRADREARRELDGLHPAAVAARGIEEHPARLGRARPAEPHLAAELVREIVHLDAGEQRDHRRL